jgi:DNA-binding SARP family transcriptional activator
VGKDTTMGLHEQLDHLYQRFQEVAQESNLIVLHPASRLRSPLVARLIDSTDYHVLYYAMGADDLSVESLVMGMTHQIVNNRPLFGRHFYTLGAKQQGDIDAVVEALCREMRDITDKPVLLILDEYDRSDPADDVQVFIERLSAHLPDHCWLVINSRTLPRLPLLSMIAQKRALILQDDSVVRDDFYGAQQPTGYDLEVYALGPGIVLVDGVMVEDWEGHLPRLLFFFALDKPVITRSEICEAFWPELDIDQAVNVFHVTKRRLHKALGVEFDVLVHDEGYYRLSPELRIDFDVNAYVAALMTARSDGRYESWQQVVDLYRGPFLQGHFDSWIQSRRLDYRAGYVEALTHMAHIRMAGEREEHALGLLMKAVNADMTREDLHRQIMALYVKLDRTSEAIGHYHGLVETYAKQGGRVSEATQQAYQAIAG